MRLFLLVRHRFARYPIGKPSTLGFIKDVRFRDLGSGCKVWGLGKRNLENRVPKNEKRKGVHARNREREREGKRESERERASKKERKQTGTLHL